MASHKYRQILRRYGFYLEKRSNKESIYVHRGKFATSAITIKRHGYYVPTFEIALDCACQDEEAKQERAYFEKVDETVAELLRKEFAK